MLTKKDMLLDTPFFAFFLKGQNIGIMHPAALSEENAGQSNAIMDDKALAMEVKILYHFLESLLAIGNFFCLDFFVCFGLVFFLLGFLGGNCGFCFYFFVNS